MIRFFDNEDVLFLVCNYLNFDDISYFALVSSATFEVCSNLIFRHKFQPTLKSEWYKRSKDLNCGQKVRDGFLLSNQLFSQDFDPHFGVYVFVLHSGQTMNVVIRDSFKRNRFVFYDDNVRFLRKTEYFFKHHTILIEYQSYEMGTIITQQIPITKHQPQKNLKFSFIPPPHCCPNSYYGNHYFNVRALLKTPISSLVVGIDCVGNLLCCDESSPNLIRHNKMAPKQSNFCSLFNDFRSIEIDVGKLAIFTKDLNWFVIDAVHGKFYSIDNPNYPFFCKYKNKLVFVERYPIKGFSPFNPSAQLC